MSTQSNVELVKKFFQVADSGKFDQLSNLFDSNAEFVIGGMKSMKGLQEIQQGFQSWSKTFPDMKCQILNTIASEDFVVVEYISRGTHEGQLEGPEGKVLQPTHRKVELQACDIYRISNGKIVLAHVYWPSMEMLKQLGALEGVKAAA